MGDWSNYVRDHITWRDDLIAELEARVAQGEIDVEEWQQRWRDADQEIARITEVAARRLQMLFAAEDQRAGLEYKLEEFVREARSRKDVQDFLEEMWFQSEFGPATEDVRGEMITQYEKRGGVIPPGYDERR